jgi:hypothetical protein
MKKALTTLGRGSAIVIVGAVIFLSLAFVILLPVGFVMNFFS